MTTRKKIYATLIALFIFAMMVLVGTLDSKFEEREAEHNKELQNQYYDYD